MSSYGLSLLILTLSFSTLVSPLSFPTISRRDAIFSIPFFPLAVANAAKAGETKGVVKLHLANGERAGLELYDISIGDTKVAAVKTVFPNGKAAQNGNIFPGMIFSQDSKNIFDKLQQGPYPLDLEIRNLAAGGDAFGDLGKPLVTAEDALRLATSKEPTNTLAGEYKITKIREVSKGIQSRRGDVLEINYVAFMRSLDGVVYDSSAQRGTGQPYQFVLGSGDMIAGVDQGCYDMRAGEIRVIEIPSLLAYGSRGNRLYGIPGNTKLAWRIELVAVNSVREGDERSRDDIEGRFAYY